LHYRGQLIFTNTKYQANTKALAAMGTSGGYQHLWHEASASTGEDVKLTWLEGSRYYTLTTAGSPGTEVLYARSGAGDPNFNLVWEPVMLQRRRGTNAVFASVIEPHGYFSEAAELSVEARGRIGAVRVLASTAEGTVVRVEGANGLSWTVMVANGPASTTAAHRIAANGESFAWTGNFAVTGLQAPR
jgi:hypothetical protein